ncbi:MAG: hypothetical protein LBB17_00915, partial [Puniceicoccales bacterium]|nr:hypothetical protein [Puniceicoccales bacterium]
MSDDNPNVGIGTTPNVQSLGKDVDVPQVGTHCVVPGSPDSQPSQAVTAPRTGFTSLCQRIAATLTSIRQFFTRRTPPAVSSPTIIAEPPLKSPDAADAGYQTASLVVGETPLRIYAKNAETLGEIQRILSQPDLRSDGEILSRATRAMESLGFPETAVDLASSGLSMGVINVSGYVTGNEDKRQQAVQREDTQVGSFQSCQTPDRAKIAGAK